MLDGSTQPGAFGVTLGAGLANAGSDAMDVATRMKAEDDKNKITAANIAMRDALNAYDRSPESLTNKQGGAADEKAYQEDLRRRQEIVKQFSEGLQEGPQTNGYYGLADDYLSRSAEEGSKHVAAQRRVYQGELSSSERVQSQRDMAANPYRDPSAEINRITKSIDIQAAREGWSKKERDIRLLEETSKGHKLVIDGMMAAEDFEGAKAYIEKWSEQIDGDTRNALTSQAKEGAELGEAIDIAERISATDMPIADQRAAVREMDLPADQTMQVINMLNSNYSVRKQELAEYRNDIMTSALTDLEQNPMMTPTQWAHANPKAWSDLTPTQRKTLGAKTFRGDPTGQTPLVIEGMIAEGNKAEALEFLENNLVRLTPKEESEYRAKIAQRTKLTGEPTTPKQDFTAFTNQYLGQKPSPKAEEKYEAYMNKFYILAGEYQRKEKEWLKDNPGKTTQPPAADRQRIFAEIGYKYAKKKWFGLSTTEYSMKDMSQEDIAKASEELRQGGYEPTPEQIVRWHYRDEIEEEEEE